MKKLFSWVKEIRSHRDELRYVKEEMKKGYLSQLREIIGLRFGPSKLGIEEYYFYRLFDDRVRSRGKKEEFLGWRKEDEIDKRMNLDDWRAIANDKLLFYSLMEGLGLPYPPIKAVYLDHRYRYLREATLLNNMEAVKDYLQNKGNYPLFLKPVQGTFGYGTMCALEYKDDKDAIVMGNGWIESVDVVVHRITANPASGYIFSELLRPHPETERLCGPRLSSVRVIVLVEQGTPRLFRAVWKIATGKNVIDNFMHGKTGNLIAAVDISSGRIERVVSGTGSALSVRTTHPDTNRELIGVYLPCWNQIKKVCLDGASALVGLRMQHWDIALCPDGPVALEVNVEGSLDLHQIASQQGIYDENLRKFIASFS